MTDKTPTKTASVPALEKAFEILDFITKSPTPVSSATIARELSLARSTTHNILQALTNKGVLHKDSNHLFSLGSYLLYWAGSFEVEKDVVAVFHELAVGFDVLTPYTITLSTLDFDKGETVFLSSYQGSSAIDFAFRRGVRVPAVFSATGKAILSQTPFDKVVAMYDTFPAPLTEKGVTDFEQLKAELDKVNATRLSLDDGQLRLGMTCMGTYIRSQEGVRLGIAVSLSDSEYAEQKDEVGAAIIALALEIQKGLGVHD